MGPPVRAPDLRLRCRVRHEALRRYETKVRQWPDGGGGEGQRTTGSGPCTHSVMSATFVLSHAHTGRQGRGPHLTHDLGARTERNTPGLRAAGCFLDSVGRVGVRVRVRVLGLLGDGSDLDFSDDFSDDAPAAPSADHTHHAGRRKRRFSRGGPACRTHCGDVRMNRLNPLLKN